MRNPPRQFSGIRPLLAIALLLTPAPASVQEPEVVQPGVISTSRNETFPAIDPSDGSLWFSVYDDNFDRQTLMRAAADGHGWAAPAVVSFSGRHGDRAPRFSPEGRLLFFSSNRPSGGATNTGMFDIWMVEGRSGDAWSEPVLAPHVNSTGRDIHNAAVRGGAMYVASNREGGMGRSDIYRIGADGAVTHLAAPINDERSQPDLWVAPDESWMILVITDHPQGLGGDDLFVSVRRNGVWSSPVNAGAPLNSAEYEYGPTVSPDGRWLYYTTHRGGSADVVRVPISTLDRLRR